jgi:hypothetical protein
MNKFFLLMAFSLMVTATYAQDIKDIRNYTLLGQTQKAKDLIDKYLAVPKMLKKERDGITKDLFIIKFLKTLPKVYLKVGL